MRPSSFRIFTLIAAVLATSSCSLPFLDHKGYTTLDFALPIPQELRSRLLSETYDELPESYRARVQMLGTPTGTIEATAEFTFADDTVSFTIADIPPGTWNLEVALLDTVSVPGTPLTLYASRRTLNVVAGENTLALSLEREAAPVTLVLMDGMTPLGSINVTTTTGHSWISASDGRVIIPALPTGVYQLAFSNPILAPTTLVVADRTAKTLEVGIQQYTLTFNGGGATGTVPAVINGASGLQVSLPGQGSMVKSGLTFIGWSLMNNNDNSIRPAGSTYEITGNTTLYALWAGVLSENEPGLVVTQTIPGETFFYAITVTGTGTLTGLTTDLTGDFDPYGVLYDSGFNVLSANDDSNGLNFMVSTTPVSPGTYYLLARPLGMPGPGNGGFTLQTTRL